MKNILLVFFLFPIFLNIQAQDVEEPEVLTKNKAMDEKMDLDSAELLFNGTYVDEYILIKTKRKFMLQFSPDKTVQLFIDGPIIIEGFESKNMRVLKSIYKIEEAEIQFSFDEPESDEVYSFIGVVENEKLKLLYTFSNKSYAPSVNSVEFQFVPTEELESHLKALFEKEIIEDKSGLIEKEPEPIEEEEPEIFMVVEDMPQFPGGKDKCMEFIYENLQYPQKAQEEKREGKVVVNFIVEKDGTLSNIRVARDIGGGCGEEAVRVVKMMPKWKPGKQRGNVVYVSYNLPIEFKAE